jgi:uncharacterized protein (TIGR02284 family)
MTPAKRSNRLFGSAWSALSINVNYSAEARMAAETLKKLHTALVDTRDAYELALKDTDDPEVAGICREMFSLRHDDHLELHQALILAGEVPGENGSFMSVVHETVVGVRAAISGISKKTLPSFASGEEDIVGLYDETLRQMGNDPKLSGTLSRQRETLLTKIERMKTLATES